TAALQTATAYDQFGHATDRWGPAPTAWFDSNHRPLSQYASSVPHAVTSYDDGIAGLAAAWWTNKDLTGPPAKHSTGVQTTSCAPASDVQTIWSSRTSGIPCELDATSATTANWGVRLTGELAFPTNGNWTLNFFTKGGVRLFIDDQLVVMHNDVIA